MPNVSCAVIWVWRSFIFFEKPLDCRNLIRRHERRGVTDPRKLNEACFWTARRHCDRVVVIEHVGLGTSQQ
jgi:hypothetical protein